MELSAEFESFIQGMEWGEVMSTVEETINTLWPDTLNLPPPPPVPCELQVNTVLQPVETQGGGLGGCFPLGAAPRVMAAPTTMFYEPLDQGDSMLPGHLYSQGGVYSQGQCNGVPVVRVPEGISQNLRPVGMLNGEVLYELPPGLFTTPVFAAPPPAGNTSQSKKTKRESQQDDNQPYVKKPPNAFMLYLKEQRLNVVAKLENRGSAALNAVMAQRWNSLTKEEQARYYKQAERERQLHAQQHPGWSTCENYGKKRKRRRDRSKAPTRAEEETQHANELCVTPARVEASSTQAAGLKASTTQAVRMEASTTQAARMEVLTTQTAGMEVLTTQTAGMEVLTTQAARMEASTTQAARMEASSTQAAGIEASTTQAARMEASTTQAARMEVLTTQTAGMEALTTQASVIEPHHQQVVWLPDRQTPVIVPVCHRCHLPQLCDVSPGPSLQYQQL